MATKFTKQYVFRSSEDDRFWYLVRKNGCIVEVKCLDGWFYVTGEYESDQWLQDILWRYIPATDPRHTEEVKEAYRYYKDIRKYR